MDELRELVVDTPAAGEPNVNSGGEMTVEDVIEQHVGSFGFAQLVHVFLVSLAWIFDSQSTLITIFSDAQPEWRCTSSMCHKGMELCHVKPGTWEWVDGDRSSTVAEWGLICGSKFRAGLPASLFFIGSIFGSAVQGRLADDYLGRKMTILLSCLLTALTTFLTSFSPNLWVYALLRFTTGFARSGIGICCLVLSTEVVGRKWRGQVGNYGFFFFTIGFLSVPAIAYPTRTSWRNLYRVLSLPPLAYSIFIVPFISESPRWLAIMGRSKEAIKVLTKFAKVNGRRLPVDIAIANPLTTGPNKNESLWSTKWAVRRIILVMIAGLGVGFVYYGVQLNVGNLNFNVYFAVGVNALMEIPAVFFGSVLMSFMNRRALFSLSALLAGASCILCMLFSHKSGSKGSWGQLSVEAFGFMTASMAYDILYIYCVELFPTNVRNFAVSMLRQALMLGAAVAPLLVVLGRMSPSVSYIVFGAFSIFSGLMTWWLPETKNAPLYETLEQQSREETVGAKPAGETEMVE